MIFLVNSFLSEEHDICLHMCGVFIFFLQVQRKQNSPFMIRLKGWSANFW